MSEQQAKPAAVILAFAQQTQQQSAIKQAAMQTIDAYWRLFAQIGYHANEFAALCRKHGRTAILAEIPEPARTALNQSLDALQTLWDAVSPNPFPDLPDDPVPEPEPEASE